MAWEHYTCYDKTQKSSPVRKRHLSLKAHLLFVVSYQSCVTPKETGERGRAKRQGRDRGRERRERKKRNGGGGGGGGEGRGAEGLERRGWFDHQRTYACSENKNTFCVTYFTENDMREKKGLTKERKNFKERKEGRTKEKEQQKQNKTMMKLLSIYTALLLHCCNYSCILFLVCNRLHILQNRIFTIK